MVRRNVARLQKNIRKPVENEYVHFNGLVADDDDASQVGGKAGWSLSSLGITTKQAITELHYESEPGPTTATPPPTKPPVMPTPIPNIGIVNRLDTTDQTVTLDSLVQPAVRTSRQIAELSTTSCLSCG